MLFLLMSLISQALEHYEDLADIKRVIVHTNLFNADVRYTGLVYAYHWHLWLTLFLPVARQLFRQANRREHPRMLEGDATCQHSPKSTDCGTGCN